MRTFQCLVLLGVGLCVGGIRVPTDWSQYPGNPRDFSHDGGSGHRFGVPKPLPVLGERRSFAENGPAKPLLGQTVHFNPFEEPSQFAEPKPKPLMVLNPNGFFVLPQTPEVNLPPLLNPRYSNLGKQAYQKPQNLAENRQDKAFDKYQILPSDVSRIKPAILGIPSIDKYRQQVQGNQVAPRYSPGVYKEYAKTPVTASIYDLYLPNSQPLQLTLNPLVPQDHTFLVSASTSAPLEFQVNRNVESSTKKEPVFFVTEGYRNVLVQGPNKKKKYFGNDFERKDESQTASRRQDPGEDEGDEEEDDNDGKPPRRRKVTKVYKIYDGNEKNVINVGGASKNLVQSEEGKPRRYFESNDRPSRLENHVIENYRDDRLHEPSEDGDSERDDEDEEKINNDSERDDIEDDDENPKTPEKINTDIHDSKEINKDAEPENNSSNDSEEESDDNESDDDEEEAEKEEDEEEKGEVPYSEHADPAPVPTKPIYPGEGQWAKPGLKHRPYVSQHRFLKPVEDERKPDGYDVFEDLEQYFIRQKDKFGNDFAQQVDKSAKASASAQAFGAPVIKPPNSPNQIVVFDPFTQSSVRNSQSAPIINKNVNKPLEESEEQTKDEEGQEEDDADDEPKTEEFVPVRLYTQVRKSEDVAHEPHNPAEHGRLKELIKDSKVQTVYSEEGYEDSAYDHAGHEKKAEEDQGYAAFERAKEEQGKPKRSQEKDSDSGHSKNIIVSDKPLVDSVASESIYRSHPIKLSDAEIAAENPKLSKSINTKNFMTSQELHTTQVKDKDNGDVQLEIESEIKVMVQPNNSTKAHKYVKIYPKVLKEISRKPFVEDDSTEKADKPLIKPENTTKTIENKTEAAISDSSTTESSTVSDIEFMTKNLGLNRQFGETQSSEKPKVVVKVLDGDGTLSKIGNRRKRAADDSFEHVNIDEEFIDFIDKVNHTFEPPKPETLDLHKYPYYTLPGINQNSPLRYAENMNNIPIKREGELSFYNKANQMECPDLPQDIDPVSDRMKNSRKRKRETELSDEEDEEEDEDVEDVEERVVGQKHPPPPKGPRIQLGDKIDCLKVRYFGENPLDSPFFKEETVGPVLPIFKQLDPNAKKPDNSFGPAGIIENINEVFNGKPKQVERKAETAVKNKIANALEESAKKIDENTSATNKRDKLVSIENELAESIRSTSTGGREPPKQLMGNTLAHTRSSPTPSPLVTLITTPKYTIQLTPNNIYDQIKLLDHLPEGDEDEVSEVTTKRLETSTLRPKGEVRKESINRKVEKVANFDERSRKPKVLTRKNDEFKEDVVAKDVVGEAEALRRRKIRPRTPIYQIFDVNRFLSTTPFSVINTAASTVLPKHKVLSEVFYKDEIKPNEQLNVFADILNNIKNSSNIETLPIQAASDFAEPSAVTISPLDEPAVISKSQPPPSSVRVKKFQKDLSNHQNTFGDDYITKKPPYKETVPESYNIQKHFHVNHQTPVKQQPTVPKTKLIGKPIQATSTPKTKNSRKSTKRRRKPTISTTSTTLRTTTNIHVPNQNTPSNHQPYVIDFIEDPEEVFGLVPPQNFGYRTIMINDDSEVRDTNDFPQQSYEYPPLPPLETTPATEGVTNTYPAPVSEINDELPTKRPLNKYYFVGLKPPVHQRARPYSEFNHNSIQVNNNLLRRRVAHLGVSRAKREAARPAYADVTRNTGGQYKEIERTSPVAVADFDDYVPHRPKNYHYDEKTGKIVYHNKPSVDKQEDEEEEYEEIEIPDTRGIYLERAEGATHPTPSEKATTKELLATATPPPEGKGLLDFVVKLKNNPSYKYIPDPSTSKPGSAASTTEAFVTVDPKSTDPPEFLSILSKVKHDKTYKYIEDPKESESKTKSRVTTPQTESDEEDVEDDDEEAEEEEEEDKSRQGKTLSRKTRQISIGNFKIFNIGDFLPKIQTPTTSNIPTNFFKKHVVERFFPKLRYMTPYDIAREYYKQTELYKFIKKHVQNSPGGQNKERSSFQIFDIGDYLPKIKPIIPQTSIDYSKYKTIERPHTRHNISSKYNSKEGEEEAEAAPEKEEVVSRPPPVANEASSSIVEEKTSIDKPVQQEKLVINIVPSTTTQRIVQTRRGTRPTTERSSAEVAEHAEAVSTRRSANRRRPLPSGFRSTRRPPASTEVTEATEHVEKIYPENYSPESPTYSDSHDKAKRVYRRRPVRIRYTTERQEEDDAAIERIVRRSVGPELREVQDQFEKEYLGT